MKEQKEKENCGCSAGKGRYGTADRETSERRRTGSRAGLCIGCSCHKSQARKLAHDKDPELVAEGLTH